jgi:hypothetical protein
VEKGIRRKRWKGEETTRDKGRENEESLEGKKRKGIERRRWNREETTRDKGRKVRKG